MITFETYNKFELKNLITSDRFHHFPFLPISLHRANSHINNPNLKDDTATLILAFEGDKLAGYIGVMADGIIHKGQKTNVGWLSTLFIHPDFRGKRIAQQLLAKACEAYGNNILITEFTPEAESMYAKSALFTYQPSLVGMSYHFYSNLKTILPLKNQKWKKALPLLKLSDSMINFCAKCLYKTQNLVKSDYKIDTHLDAETEAFIITHKKQSCFDRDIRALKWIVDYPWILSGTKTDKREYQFSDFEPKFETLFIKIYKDHSLETLLILSVRNRNMKLQFVIGKQNPSLCSQVIYRFALENEIVNFICYDNEINAHFEKKTIIFKKSKYRKFLMHKDLVQALGEDFVFDVSPGDADAIFT